MNRERQEKLLSALPASPGVYLFKGSKGVILYIGKAKNLRQRVRSYFAVGTSDTRYVATHIHKLVVDVEVILTDTEKEAFLLENTLIKEHGPKFNIRLRDDKRYLSLRLDLMAKWPRLEIVRRPRQDRASYFGPYHSSSAVRETLKIVQKSFKLRSCKDGFMRNRTRPCIQHQMHRCMAPCVLDVDRDEYLGQAMFVQLFLQGRHDDLLRELRARMRDASMRFEYERAAVFRDQIAAVETTLAPQRVSTRSRVERDVIGFCREGPDVQMAILEFRGGNMVGRSDFHYGDQEFQDDDILSSFILQRYVDSGTIPDEVVVSIPVGAAGILSEILTERRGKKTVVARAVRGEKAAQAKMADLNAALLLKTRLEDDTAILERLTVVQKKLRLSSLPRRIECVDISHLGGTGTVGAISALVDGQVRAALARTYHVRTAGQGDDFGAMKEVLSRRFARARSGEPGWEAPDLMLVDGGRGQLSIALAALRELGIEGQAVVAIAKERGEGGDAETDRVFLPGRKNPIPLKARMSELHILALARDEAHRKALSFQRKTRKKKTLVSELDRVPGIGAKTRRALLQRLGSVKRIKEASIEELISVAGVGEKLAERIRSALCAQEDNG